MQLAQLYEDQLSREDLIASVAAAYTKVLNPLTRLLHSGKKLEDAITAIKLGQPWNGIPAKDLLKNLSGLLYKTSPIHPKEAFKLLGIDYDPTGIHNIPKQIGDPDRTSSLFARQRSRTVHPHGQPNRIW